MRKEKALVKPTSSGNITVERNLRMKRRKQVHGGGGVTCGNNSFLS